MLIACHYKDCIDTFTVKTSIIRPIFVKYEHAEIQTREAYY